MYLDFFYTYYEKKNVKFQRDEKNTCLFSLNIFQIPTTIPPVRVSHTIFFQI